MAKVQGKGKKHRLSMLIDDDLYKAYQKEVSRIGWEDDDYTGTVTSLIAEAMIEHAKKFKGK